MRRPKVFLVVVGVLLVYLSFPWPLSAHEPHICPEGLPDTPALSGNIRQVARHAFVALDVDDQATIISFLKTLQVLPTGAERIAVDMQ